MHDDGSSAATTISSRLGRLLRGRTRNASLLLGLLVWIVYVASQNANFLTSANLRVVGLNMAFTAIAAIGTAILVISGSIDLSIGSVFALTAITAAEVSSDVPTWIAFAIGVSGRALPVGAVNGLLSWLIPISPIVITLGSMALIRGVVLVWTKNTPISDTSSDFSDFARSVPLGVPSPVLVMLAALVLISDRHEYDHDRPTPLRDRRQPASVPGGRHSCPPVSSSAPSPSAARWSALAGVLAAGRYGSPDATYGTGFELVVITGVLLGGVSFAGGEGSVRVPCSASSRSRSSTPGSSPSV